MIAAPDGQPPALGPHPGVGRSGLLTAQQRQEVRPICVCALLGSRRHRGEQRLTRRKVVQHPLGQAVGQGMHLPAGARRITLGDGRAAVGHEQLIGEHDKGARFQRAIHAFCEGIDCSVECTTSRRRQEFIELQGKHINFAARQAHAVVGRCGDEPNAGFPPRRPSPSCRPQRARWTASRN